MSVMQLAELLRVPSDYILFLKGVLDGSETHYTFQDENLVIAFQEELTLLNLDREE